MICADCKGPIGQDCGPPDGWKMEDGRIVCHACCVEDTLRELQKIHEARQRKAAADKIPQIPIDTNFTSG